MRRLACIAILKLERRKERLVPFDQYSSAVLTHTDLCVLECWAFITIMPPEVRG